MCRSGRQRLAALGGAALLATALAGCSGESFQPPPRSAAVLAEEVRIAALIERAERAGYSGAMGKCNVRFLGSEGTTAFVWAHCTYPPSSGVSTAFRIEGSTVLKPQDGSLFEPSVRRLFPSEIADAILDHSDALRPAEP